MGWVDDYFDTTVKLIALAEVVGAIGLVLPIATGIMQALSPIAGAALTVIMAGAIAVHLAARNPPLRQSF